MAALSARAGDFPSMKSRGTLRVLVSTDEQPEMYSLQPAGNPGFDREILEGFASLHRIKLETVVRPFEEVISDLVKDQGDLIIGLVDTETRRKLIDFTTEVLPTRHVVLTRKPQPPITNLEALRAARVGVVTGTSWADAVLAAGVPASRSEPYAELGAVLDALKAKKVNATVVSLVDATLAIRKDPELQTGLLLGTQGRACFGLRKGDVELKKALDEYIDGLRKTGTWSRLVVKYFGDRALAVLGRAKED